MADDDSHNEANERQNDEQAEEDRLEQLLLAQEREQQLRDQQDQPQDVDDQGMLEPAAAAVDAGEDGAVLLPQAARGKIPYTQSSFGAALALIFYAMRTRQQWYLAFVYLTSSKWAYIVLGNAVVAWCVSMFRWTVSFFLKGLRPAEAEGLGDFFRWNVTETCLALTMFRSEINVRTGILFLFLVLAKCLHWVADMREGHLRMTQEAIVAIPNGYFKGWPTLQSSYIGLVALLQVLLVLDVVAIVHTGYDVAQNGPSVAIFFGFEATILFVSAMSNTLLSFLHFCDGMIHWAHEEFTDQDTLWHKYTHSILHKWKDHKATLTFAVEVQAQAAKFLFYICFFGIVLTYYGMPINLFREVYMSFQNLRRRLVAFATYRRLMASMNRFESLQTDEELEEAGRVCIICRDVMTLADCKKLPGCGHVFHRSCLREWLVQQQTCPTCRSDITAMEARERNAERQRQAQVSRDEQAAADAGEERPAAAAPVPEERPTAIAGSAPPAAAGTQAPIATQEPRSLQKRQEAPPTPTLLKEAPQKDMTPQGQDNAFPCLYRVAVDAGAVVWKDTTDVASRPIRHVPSGTLLLCTELQWRTCDGSSGMMLRIPGGWVREDVLERLAIPLPNMSSSDVGKDAKPQGTRVS